MDVFGNMYISDGEWRIRKINTDGIITTVAGNGVSGFSGDGGPATAARLNGASGVFPDNCGNFYIGDGYNNRIRKVDGHGIITTIAGNGYGADSTPLKGGHSGDGGPATAAELFEPGLVYLDNNGNIYIADGFNFRVRYIKMDSCKSVMGTSPQPSPKEREVYPNPVSDELHITGVTEITKYRILNVAGGCLQQGALHKGENTLSLRYFAQGIYILEVVEPNGERSMRRVVKE